MCTLWSDNTCVFTRFHSVKNANTQLIWSSAHLSFLCDLHIIRKTIYIYCTSVYEHHYKFFYIKIAIFLLFQLFWLLSGPFPQSFIRVWFFWESRLQHKCTWWLQVLWNFWNFEIFWNFWNFVNILKFWTLNYLFFLILIFFLKILKFFENWNFRNFGKKIWNH
jgi:hypothetical protein